MTANSEIWDKSRIQLLLAKSDKALAQALWGIYQRQTETEKAALQTMEHNKIGFNGPDAEFLSDIAKRLPRYDFNMTARQIRAVRPKMMKYWRQLLQLAEAKGAAVDYRAKPLKNDPAKPRKVEMARPMPHGAPAEPASMWGAF